MQAASQWGQIEPAAAACTIQAGASPPHPPVNFSEPQQLSLGGGGAPRMSDPEPLMSGLLGEGTQLGTAEKGVLVPLLSGPGLP